MLASEKETLFNLIKTASQYVNGYTKVALQDKPSFTDDNVCISENESVSVEKSNSGMTLHDIEEKISRCTRCGLARTRTNTVPGIGPENVDVIILGEGPGADEDAKGEPFVGKAGQLLDKMLGAIKLDRHKNCYITNVVKCRPPQNRDPFGDEAAACSGFLEAQINIIKPKLILCVGKVAAHNLLKNELSVSSMRGHWYDYNGIPVLVTYHPSALLRDESYKKPAWDDLRQFGSKLKEVSPSYAALFN